MSDLTQILPSWSQMERIARAAEEMAKTSAVRAPRVYAFHLNDAESAPDAKITYLGDCANYTPAHMDFTKGKFEWGSWRDAFFLPRPCMVKYDGTVDYYLNEYDYTMKENGSESDIANPNYAGNAMMEWGRNGQRIYLKIVPDTNDPCSATFYIANERLDSEYHAWPFINNQGALAEHFYTAIYNSSTVSSTLRSLSGQSVASNLNTQTEVTQAKANNKASDVLWYTETYSERLLITVLLWLMGRSTDTQAVYGQGITSGGENTFKAYKTGVLDKMGMFYGYSDTTHAVKTFGMENFWGLQWRRVAGLMNDKGTIKYKLTYGRADGSTADSYNFDATGYKVGASLAGLAATEGWLKSISYKNGIMEPAKLDGNSASYYADYSWYDNNQLDYALFGGDAGAGSRCGASCLALNGAPSTAWWSRGAALSCKPLA